MVQTPVRAGYASPTVTWEQLPDNFVLPDDPVDNLTQPLLAAALTEMLDLAGRLQPGTLVGTNFGICATIDGRLAIKAPDWFFIPSALPTNPPNKTRRSYTPHLEGEPPSIVMEFLSDTDGGEYSIKTKPPVGKWFYYEQILKVPVYVIFEPELGWLEVYHLTSSGGYQLQTPNEFQRYWIAAIGLYLGVWQGSHTNRTGYWLRWWDETGGLLLWGEERIQQEREHVEQERQRAEQERQRAEQECQRAEQERQRREQLEAFLRSQGLDPDRLPDL
jgi:Uma2 family endonuclease